MTFKPAILWAQRLRRGQVRSGGKLQAGVEALEMEMDTRRIDPQG